MPRFFFGNFDFEYELTAPAGKRAGARRIAHQQTLAFAAAWLGLATPDDFVWSPRPLAADEFPDLAAAGVAVPRFVSSWDEVRNTADVEFVPWGWSNAALAIADKYGWSSSHPPLDVVRTVNSREFRWQLEQELGVALPASAIARSPDDLQSLISRHGDLPRGWILKANFGMSGRESVRGRGNGLPESQARWAAKRLESSGPILFEPLVERVAEAGVQIEIPCDGPPHLVGVCELIVDGSGVYRGSRFDAAFEPDDPWRPAVDVALAVASRLQSLGYFGPLGIDAMQYRDEAGQLRLRPLQDLNARFTMGRLALGFRRLLPPGWCASWLWARSERQAALEHPLPLSDDSVRHKARFLRTSPIAAKMNEPRSLLVIADSRATSSPRAFRETDY